MYIIISINFIIMYNAMYAYSHGTRYDTKLLSRIKNFKQYFILGQNIAEDKKSRDSYIGNTILTLCLLLLIINPCPCVAYVRLMIYSQSVSVCVLS